MNLLYTIVPPEAIFGPDEASEGEVATVELMIDGVSVMVEPLGPGRGKVQRLLSTDPRHYLDQRWQPGETIYW